MFINSSPPPVAGAITFAFVVGKKGDNENSRSSTPLFFITIS